MQSATTTFITLYKNNPALALERIDVFSMQHPYFDGKRAAEACGLVWDGGYKINTPDFIKDMIEWRDAYEIRNFGTPYIHNVVYMEGVVSNRFFPVELLRREIG